MVGDAGGGPCEGVSMRAVAGVASAVFVEATVGADSGGAVNARRGTCRV